MIFYLAQT